MKIQQLNRRLATGAMMLVTFVAMTACATSQGEIDSTPAPTLEIPADGAFVYRLKVLGVD